jgi:Flp pilus assembly protein TadD
LNQATQLWEAGRKDEARALYEQTLEANEPKLGSFPRWVGMSIRSPVGIAGSTGQYQEAMELYQLLARLSTDESSQENLGWMLDGIGIAFQEKGQLDQCIALHREAIRLSKNNFRVVNNLAWLLATCTDPQLRDIVQAVQLAQQAVELEPRNAAPWNTLGVCLYRSGDYDAAIEALEKSEALEPANHLAFDGFFLAMAHWQRGEKEKARTWYGQAVQWMDKNQPQNAELHRFRAEAEELLGIKAQPR